MPSKDLIDDPRTIYSLAMVLILYEVYKSEFLNSENPLIFIIKIGLLILISTQLIFLYLCGLSRAKIKGEFKKKLSEMANDSYETGFQLSVVIFSLDISFGIIYYLFKDYGFFFTLWGKIILIIINFLIAVGTIRIRQKCFEPIELIDEDNHFYYFIGFWVFATSLVIIMQ